jgi:glycosyltransferase involved in cell wall biosynthesis
MLWLCLRFRKGVFAWPRKVFFKEFLQAGYIAEQVLAASTIRHLHAHFAHGATTIAMLASRLTGLPFSFTAHAKDIYLAELNPGHLLTTKLRRARFVVTCTEANKTYLQAHLRTTPIHVIYHGLDTALFKPAFPRTTPAKPMILSVGRMVEKKGFNYLLAACRRLKDSGYDFQCRIIGGADKHTPVIEALIEQLQLSDIVTLQPAVTQEELASIYNQATLFALPCQIIDNGDRDGIPNVLVEAMAMELPVVSTNISGIPELVEHRHNGLLVEQKSAAALASAMSELLNNPGLRKRLGLAARERVCRLFDARTNTTSLKTLFTNAVGAPASCGQEFATVTRHLRSQEL